MDTVFLALHGDCVTRPPLVGKLGGLPVWFPFSRWKELTWEEGRGRWTEAPRAVPRVVPCISTTCQRMCAEQTMDQYFWILIFIHSAIFIWFFYFWETWFEGGKLRGWRGRVAIDHKEPYLICQRLWTSSIDSRELKI